MLAAMLPLFKTSPEPVATVDLMMPCGVPLLLLMLNSVIFGAKPRQQTFAKTWRRALGSAEAAATQAWSHSSKIHREPASFHKRVGKLGEGGCIKLKKVKMSQKCPGVNGLTHTHNE